MPDDERRAGYGGGRFSLRALILLLLTSAFISGFPARLFPQAPDAAYHAAGGGCPGH